MDRIWVDKYRPRKLNEIVGQDAFIKRIKSFIETKNLPHLLFAGSPGTGKTTTALVIANEIYGEGGLKGNFLELNASDDRGIDVIRTKIKEFARLKSLVSVPYKIIYLDEADSLTKEAQQALRRTMEKFSESCRFILACNEISKIIDPIQSRCVIFRFKPLPEEALLKIIEKIEKNEGIEVDKEAKKTLVKISRGDVRKLENMLQAAASVNSKITKKVIQEIFETIDELEIKDLVETALLGNFFNARDKLLKLKTIKGYTPLEILKEIYNYILNKEIDSTLKIKIVDKIASIEFRLVEGSDDEIQLESLLALLSSLKLQPQN